ncbi:DUF3786 domain-containing protein [Tepidanaerobacter sp. GT38]|uniref:DUF3786 domain-containing protein n=1 Tax=Tepidanaerobacter sp. GT38 TaxID=2722793 RepID=UPI001F220588|nr:DUF3786 domain-containing protein [Tepidanaerobacter sp. GT38]MCG1012865.1 DUF3786 domain-containing protein [Tepidanaerobacter sp. GT38]
MKNNYLVAINKGWEDLSKKKPEEVAECMKVSYIRDRGQFVVPHLNEEYIVDCRCKTVRNRQNGSLASSELTILILHYLTFFTQKRDLERKWISLKEVPNGGILFYPAFFRESIQRLIKTFGYDSQLFLSCAGKLGGFPGILGTASAIFYVFPKVCTYVVIWEGDEEIPANATLLFDKSIEHFLHIESIIGVGGYLIKRLILEAKLIIN